MPAPPAPRGRRDDGTPARTAGRALPVRAGRHCWVYPPRECSHVPRAGLLLEWRRTAAGFEGLVVYLADLGGGRSLSQVQEWVAADNLRPHR